MRHILIAMSILFCWTAETALAHRVNIFAWVEGNTVYTESKFSGGKKVKNGLVEIYGKNGTKLLEGKTGELGEFSFPAVRKTGMKAVLIAGTGHRAEWTIAASEFQGNDPEPAAPEKIKEAAREKVKKVSASPCMDAEEIRDVVEKAVYKKFQPMMRELKKSQNTDQEPDFRDILGGIGYIMGLIGVAAYVHSRKKRE